jgi:hypothetical protein
LAVTSLRSGGDGFARDDLAADGGLDRDLEHLCGGIRSFSFSHIARPRFRRGAVDQHRQRIDRLVIDQDRHLHQIALARSREV